MSRGDRINSFRIKSAWKANFVIIGILIIAVLVYFFWQIRHAEKTFINQTREHTKMLAKIIQMNAGSVMLSQKIVEEIIETFLGNSARFIDYLDAVESFSSEELIAFSAEAGLSGIRIIKDGGGYTEGPQGWFPIKGTSATSNYTFSYLKDRSLYFLVMPRVEKSGCIIVGFSDTLIDKLKEQIALPKLLDMLAGLADILYVRIEKRHVKNAGDVKDLEVRFVDNIKGKIAEARLFVGSDALIVGLNASKFFIRVNQLRTEFVIFSIIIAILGAFFSWLLYRYQVAHLNQLRSFERRLAREKEDASLGRASAAITHEIRNPLNAIGMGLQRLQIEAGELDDEYKILITNLLKAVQRTNGIIAELRRFSRPLVPRMKKIRPDLIIEHILSLYQQACKNLSLSLDYRPEYHGTVIADSGLMEEVVENIIKNAVEAQPDGGYIKVRLFQQGAEVVLSIENRGFKLPKEDAEQILNPYFTTKMRGSGLGLAIAVRIINAHEGRLEVRNPKQDVIQINLFLPIERKNYENSISR